MKGLARRTRRIADGLEMLEVRRVLDALPFAETMIGEAGDFQQLMTDDELSLLIGSQSNRVVSWQQADGFSPRVIAEFASEVRDVAPGLDESILVATDTEVWRIESPDPNPRLLLDGLSGIEHVAEASEGIGLDIRVDYIYVASNNSVLRYESESLDTVEQVAAGEIRSLLAYPKSIRNGGGGGAVFTSRSGPGVDVFFSTKYPNHGPVSPELVKHFADASVVDVALARVDADQTLDLVMVADTGEVATVINKPTYWWSSADFEEPVSFHNVWNASPRPDSIEVAVKDLDGNELVDVVISTQLTNPDGSHVARVSWLENLGGVDFAEHELASGEIQYGVVAVQDTNLDGTQDVVTAGAAGLLAFQFVPHRPFDLPLRWESEFSQSVGRTVAFVDLDGDDDLDVVARSHPDRTAVWYRNLDGRGTFGDGIVIGDGRLSSHLFPMDVDADGNVDLVTSNPFDLLAWYPNLDGQGSLGDPIKIAIEGASASSTPRAPYRGWDVGDLDGDGDADIVHGGQDSSVWIENRGLQEPMLGHLIEKYHSKPETERVEVVDVDGDGDLDVVSSRGYWFNSESRYELEWYENVNGHGNQRFRRRPIDVAEMFSEHARLAISAFDVLDFDADDDLDIVTMTTNGVFWYENQGAASLFSRRHLVLGSGDVAAVVDLDRDGDYDFLAEGGIWYEGTGNHRDFRRRVHDLEFDQGALSLADLDSDGDDDLVRWTHVTWAGGIRWYRNIAAAVDVRGDVNLDGVIDELDVDLTCRAISSGSVEAVFDLDRSQTVDRHDMEILIIQSLGTVFGDSNLDGRFDDADLVNVFQAGLYEQGLSDDASWMTGDWNCDGQFDSSDLVDVMRRGGWGG